MKRRLFTFALAALTIGLLGSCSKINERIDGLDKRVYDLENAKIASVEQMIQSVSITPAYSDGSVEADKNGILTLKCIVNPAEALIGMESLKDSLLIYADSVKVKTKGASAYMEIEVSEASVLDAAQGVITLKANISEYLPKGEDKALTVAVNIKNGISDFTTEFVPVTVAAPLPAGALKGVFSVSATKKVRFSKGNLYWDGDSFELETNQYDVQSSWSTSHVSHFFWSKDASVAYAASYSESGTAVTDVFFTNDPTDAEKAKADFTVNGVTGEYRTLSNVEWNYLFSRTSKHGFATVGGVYGIIILPDTFTDPMKNGGSGAFEPLPKQGYDKNVYTIGGNWEAMESAGAVFLPVTNFRKGTNFDQWASGAGHYWSSIVKNASRVYGVIFNEGIVYPNNFDHERNYGKSVRLVTDVK